MKSIFVLVAVQTVLVIALFMKIDSYEARLAQSAPPLNQIDSQKLLTMQSPSEAPVIENTGLTSSEVRRIIREELNANSLQSELIGADVGSEKELPAYDNTEMQIRQELVVERLELLKARDEVSSGEIESLIGEISQLDPVRRTAMMKNLNGAINRGEIKGHL